MGATGAHTGAHMGSNFANERNRIATITQTAFVMHPGLNLLVAARQGIGHVRAAQQQWQRGVCGLWEKPWRRGMGEGKAKIPGACVDHLIQKSAFWDRILRAPAVLATAADTARGWEHGREGKSNITPDVGVAEQTGSGQVSGLTSRG